MNQQARVLRLLETAASRRRLGRRRRAFRAVVVVLGAEMLGIPQSWPFQPSKPSILKNQTPVFASLIMIRPSWLRTSMPNAPWMTLDRPPRRWSRQLRARARTGRCSTSRPRGMRRVVHAEDLQAILVPRDEDKGPADLVVVGEIVPVGVPGADRPVTSAPCPRAGLEVEDAERRVLVFGLGDGVTPSGVGVNVWPNSMPAEPVIDVRSFGWPDA